MAALAVGETEIAAERSFASVTRRTRLSARGDEVLGGGRRAHLPRLRCTRGYFVTVSALEALARTVLRVTERVTKGARIRRRWPVRFLIVTDAARRDLTAGI